MGDIRTRESNTSDVFVNVNDLIIGLMVELERAPDPEKPAIRRIISRLTALRDKSHGKTSKF